MFNAKSERVDSVQSENELQNKLITILNHHRHSWLNDLQLIFGYIKLNKYDRLEAYVERLKQKLENESRISSIPDPTLVLELLLFGYDNQTFKLNVQIEHDSKHLLERSEFPLLNDMLLHMLNTFQRMAYQSNEMVNELTLHIHNENDEVIVLVFDYLGHYDRARWIQLSDGEHADERLNKVTWHAEDQRLRAMVTVNSAP